VTSASREPQRPLLRAGSVLLTIAALAVLPAAFVIGLNPRLGLDSRLGRHLFAGALGLGCLSLLLALLAALPLRRGEKWAFWAYAGAFFLVGLPVVAADAVHVPRSSLLATVAPQVAGLLLATAGLALCAQDLFGTSD
jgi:hypothetical protein